MHLVLCQKLKKFRPSRCMLIGTFIKLIIVVTFWLSNTNFFKKSTYTLENNSTWIDSSTFVSGKLRNCEKCLDAENREERITDKDGHRLAVIVPFRNCLEELLKFAPHIHSYLNNKSVPHTIYVVNQMDKYRFNRASLINAGFLESCKYCDYIAIHDVDLLPLNSDLNYGYPANGPFHLTAPDLHPLYHREAFIGGIILMTKKHFSLVNGMSNKFWGWDNEGHDFYDRIKEAQMNISRSKNIKTGYKTFRHLHDCAKQQRDKAKSFNETEKLKQMDTETGLSTLEYSVTSVNRVTIENAPLIFVNVHLKCDINVTPWCLTDEQKKRNHFVVSYLTNSMW